MIVEGPQGGPPPHGITTLCRIVDVYDGDTVVVEIVKTARVRLLDCWAPEVKGGTPEEKERGYVSRDHLKQLALNKEAVLFVPSAEHRAIGEVTSMGRVLGQLWIDGDKKSLAEHQRDAGLATLTKE